MDNTIFTVIDNTVKQAECNAELCGEDYRDADGILICGKCHTPKEKFLKFNKSGDFYERYKNRLFPVLCRCRKDEQEAEKERQRQVETQMLVKQLRKEGITDDNYLRYTFSEDDNKHPDISRACKKYADNFTDMYKLGKGIIFCGQVGTGKTFYAGCIANAVVLQAKSVLMTNIPSLITKLGYSQEEKNYILNRISNVSLLVIDDLGAERDTTYALEKIYEIIDTRYRSGKPLIITTNLKPKDMKAEQNVSYKRIYDRIFQMCCPIAVLGQSRRIEKAEASAKFMNEFLGLNQSF